MLSEDCSLSARGTERADQNGGKKYPSQVRYGPHLEARVCEQTLTGAENGSFQACLVHVSP